MANPTELLTQIFALAPELLQALLALIAAASAITALTPTPRDDHFLGQLYAVLEVLALNIGRAKDQPPNHLPPR